MIKLSDFVIDYLSKLNISKVFVIQGGAVAHLIDSISKNEKIDYITCQHEQACAMAADGYSRTSKSLGVAIATSGPGATNLITGITSAYYDSIPVIFITGNVTSFRQSTGMGIRQYGFQETNIIDIVKPITKYCISLDSPLDIKYILGKAIHIALKGRKGPVLIDIPDDYQREYINEKKLKSFEETPKRIKKEIDFKKINTLLNSSKRAVLVYGNGVLSSNSINLATKLSEKLNIPTLYSWPLKGIFNFSHKLNFGSFGTNSPRSGNFIIQNSDLIISIGNRLDTHATGSLKDFAREAKIIAIDIDNNELEKFEKFGKKINLTICQDAKVFIKKAIKEVNYTVENKEWITYCSQIKNKFKKALPLKHKFVNPQEFFKQLSKVSKKETIFIGDTGANLVYLLNNLKEKRAQRFISAFNNTPMGYALPASIGVALANPNKNIICCIGDGGIQMNIQELATIKYYNLPILILVFNNFGHGMIKQTQDDWFNSEYHGSSLKYGIPKINFKNIAKAYNIEAIRLKKNSNISKIINNLEFNKPLLIEILLDEHLRIDPMIQFGRPLEDMNPLLTRKEFMDNMIIQPLQVSKQEIK